MHDYEELLAKCKIMTDRVSLLFDAEIRALHLISIYPKGDINLTSEPDMESNSNNGQICNESHCAINDDISLWYVRSRKPSFGIRGLAGDGSDSRFSSL